MTQPGVASAGDAKVTEPATESPELLGVAGAGEQKTQPGESAEPEVAAANYHTQGTGQPGEEDSAAEPAMAAPELLGVPAAGPQGLQHATIEAQEEPVTESAEVLGVAGAGEQKTQPGDSASQKSLQRTTIHRGRDSPERKIVQLSQPWLLQSCWAFPQLDTKVCSMRRQRLRKSLSQSQRKCWVWTALGSRNHSPGIVLSQELLQQTTTHRGPDSPQKIVR